MTRNPLFVVALLWSTGVLLAVGMVMLPVAHAASPVTYKMIVIPAYHSDQTAPPAHPTNVELSENAAGVAAYYEENSYGAVHFETEVAPVWVHLATPKDTCAMGQVPWDDMQAILDTAIVANPSVSFAEYDVIVFAAPNAYCRWAGIAMGSTPFMIGGKTSRKDAVMIAFDKMSTKDGAFWPAQVREVISHELGHVDVGRFVMHASFLKSDATSITKENFTSDTVLPYSDPYSVMGGSVCEWTGCPGMFPGHFNAPQKEKAGWLEASSIKTIDTAGSWTMTLTPIESSGSGMKAVKIKRTGNDYFYVEFRQPIGFDSVYDDSSDAKPVFRGQVFDGALVHLVDGDHEFDLPIHTQTVLLDASVGVGNPTDNRTPALPAGSTFTDTLTGISITTVRVDVAADPNKSRLVVKVTRPIYDDRDLRTAVFDRATSMTVSDGNSDSYVSGKTVNVRLVSDTPMFTMVTFAIDGVVKRRDLMTPYGMTFDSRKLTNGTHVITAKFSPSNDVITKAVTIRVKNELSVSFTNVVGGSALKGRTALRAKTLGGAKIRAMEYFLDGRKIATGSTKSPYSATIDFSKLPKGRHRLCVRATDSAGKHATKTITIYIKKD